MAPFALAAALAPVLGAGGPAAPAAAVQAGDEAFDPAAVYLRDCASCHGADGEGTPRGPTLKDVGPAFLDYELSTGRMPIKDPEETVRRKDPAYSPSEIHKLVDYVATLGGGGEPIPHVDLEHADMQRGGELYRADCAACHALVGAGGGLLFQEAPDLHRSTPVQTAEAIIVGPGTMPSFPYHEEDLNAVVAYVHELQKPDNRGGHPLWHIGPLAEGLVVIVVGMGAVLLLLRWIGEAET